MSYSIGFDIFAKDKASATFDKLGKKVGSTESTFSKHSAKMKIAAAAVGVAVIKFGTDSVAAYTDAEAQQRILTDAYARFPALADVSVQSLRDQAQALQDVTKFDGDATAAAMGTLAQFKLTGKQVKDLTPLMLDYAEKTGKDLPDAAADLGKAMLGQGKALKGVGINFKDLKDPTKNLDQLMGGLRKQVGGFATKEGKEAEGHAAILKNKFGDLQEKVGSKLLPVMNKLTDAGLKVVDWMGKNEGKVKILAAGMGAFVVVLGVAKTVTLATAAAHVLMAAGVTIWSTASKIATAGQWLLNAALTANPIGLVVVAIGLLVAGIVLIAKKTTWFQTIWKVMTDGLGKAWQWLWNTILAPVIRFVLTGFANITDGIANMLGILSHIPGFGWAKVAADKMHGAAAKARALANGIKDIPDKKHVAITLTGRNLLGAQMSALITSTNKRLGMDARASGGPTAGGRPYLVGENGPEIWSDARNGHITNAADTARILAGRGGSAAGVGGGTIINNFTINGAVDPAGVGRQIQQIMLQLKRNSGGELGLA